MKDILSEMFEAHGVRMVDVTPKIPNPGSDEAIALGDICPILDNEFGRGAYNDGKTFWITEGCPLHAPKKNLKLVKRKKRV